MDEPADPAWPRRLAAEMFGTFALVFVAVGADAMAVVSGGLVSVAARAVAPGLMVAALIYAIGDASGAHFNPVVSLAFTLKRLFPVGWLVPYWASQLVGAVAAALAVGWLFGDAVRAGVSTPHVADGTAVALEAVLTWLLVTVILGTADRYPARSFGPALVAGDLGNVWIYVVGPALGALLAVLITRVLHGSTAADPKAADAAQGHR